MDVTIEQICRDLLEIAIRDGLVIESNQFDDPHPQRRTSGELAGMANRLQSFRDQKRGGCLKGESV